MLNACFKWVSHIFRNSPYHGSNGAIRLARLAADLIDVQQDYYQAKRDGREPRSNRVYFMLSNQDGDFLLNRQVEEVYDLVVASVVKQPFFPGDVYEGDGWTEQDTWPKIRVTMAWDGYRSHHPTVPHELVHILGLPKLAQNKIFFYSASKEWVKTAITKGQLRGLKKAAVWSWSTYSRRDSIS